MRKIDFVKFVMQKLWGEDTQVEYEGNGSTFLVTSRGRRRLVYCDTLKSGRMSLKVKPCAHEEHARGLARRMWNAVYYSDLPLDAAAKADVYSGDSSRDGCAYWVARLMMDRVWDIV